MNNKQISDKAIFVVGLLAAFMAFSVFKDGLSKIFLNIGGNPVNLWGMMKVFLVLLTLSVYLYSLDLLRYSFGRFQNFILFRIPIIAANFFYFSAIIFPIFILLFWILSDPIVMGFMDSHKQGVISFDIIAITALVSGSVVFSFLQNRLQKNYEISRIDKLKSDYLQRALRLYNNKFYSETVSESFKALELFLRERLLEEKNFQTKYIPLSELIYLANKKELFNSESLKKITELQRKRNLFVHTKEKASEKDAFDALNVVRDMLEGGE